MSDKLKHLWFCIYNHRWPNILSSEMSVWDVGQRYANLQFWFVFLLSSGSFLGLKFNSEFHFVKHDLSDKKSVNCFSVFPNFAQNDIFLSTLAYRFASQIMRSFAFWRCFFLNTFNFHTVNKKGNWACIPPLPLMREVYRERKGSMNWNSDDPFCFIVETVYHSGGT